MKQITYTGFYGHKNTGDDAFLEVVSYYSKKYNHTPFFLGKNLPQLVTDYKCFNNGKLKGKLEKIEERFKSLKPISQSDYFLSAGGSTFGSHKRFGFKEIAKNIKKYHNKNLKTGAIGVSIGPFKSINEELKVIEYLKTLDYLSVRDKKSYDYLKSLNLDYNPIESFDLAALLPQVYRNSNQFSDNSSEKILGISLCNYESYYGLNKLNEQRRNNSIFELLKIVYKRDNSIKFRFFIFNGNSIIGDKQITLETINKLNIVNYEIIEYQNDVKKSWDLIGQCKFIISTRLHAAIFAAFNNVPFILNEYHRKCTDFLTDIGQHTSYIYGDADYEVQALSETIVNIINNNKIYILPQNLDKCIKLSKNNFLYFNHDR